MSKSKQILLVIALIVASLARPYSGANAGVAWDWGGIEIKGDPGLFLCAASWNPTNGVTWHNQLAQLFPSLVVDC